MAPLAIVQKLINEANELIEDPTEKLSASSILAAQDQEEGDKRSDHRESIQEENSSVATISSEIEIKNPLTIQDHEIKLEAADVERFDIVEGEKVIVEKTYYFPDKTIDIGSETESDEAAISEEPLICHSESFESDNQLDSKGIDVIQDTSKSIHQAASIAKSKDLNASSLLIDNRISTTEEGTTHKEKVIEIVDEEYPFDKSSQAETNRSLHDLQDSSTASNIVPDSNKEVLPIDETDKSSSALELYAEKQTDVVTESTLFSKNVLRQTLKQIYSERQEPNNKPTSKLDTSYPIKEGIATTAAAAIDNTKEEIKRILHPDDPVTRDSSSLSKKEHPRTTISVEKGLAANQETIISDEPFLDHRSIEEDSDSSSLEQIKPSDLEDVASFKVEHSSSSEKQELSYQCQGDKAAVLSEEPKLDQNSSLELQDNTETLSTTPLASSEIYITETLLDQTCSVKIDKDSIIPVLSTESSSATLEDSTTIATTKTLSDKNNIDIEPSSSSPPKSILDPPLESSTQPLITENLDQIHHHSSSAECSEQIQIAAEESSSEPIPASGESITPKSDQIEPEPETGEIYIPNSEPASSTINQPQVESDRSEHSKNIQNQEHVVLLVSESQSQERSKQKSIISEQILSPNESSSSVIPTDIPSSDQIELSESIETYQATVKSSEEIVANKNQWQIPQHQTIKQSSDSKEIEELPTQILEKDTFEQPSGHTETETNKTSWGKKILKGSALAVGAIAGAAVVIPALGAAAAASAASSAAASAAASLASASAAGAGVSATTGVAAAASATAAGAAYVATKQQPQEEEATTEEPQDLDSANSNYS